VTTNNSPALATEAIVNPRRRRRRWTGEQKAALLARFAASELTATRFCREFGVHAATFSQWRRRSAVQPSASGKTGFAQVKMEESSASHESVLVELNGGVRVSVPVGADPVWVGRLLQSVRHG
jgi:transposase-like protein